MNGLCLMIMDLSGDMAAILTVLFQTAIVGSQGRGGGKLVCIHPEHPIIVV